MQYRASASPTDTLDTLLINTMRRPRLLMLARPCLLLAASAAIPGAGAFQPPAARTSAVYGRYGYPSQQPQQQQQHRPQRPCATSARRDVRANRARGWALEGRIRGESEGRLEPNGDVVGDDVFGGGGGLSRVKGSEAVCDSVDGAADGLAPRSSEPAKALRAGMLALGGASCLSIAGEPPLVDCDTTLRPPCSSARPYPPSRTHSRAT